MRVLLPLALVMVLTSPALVVAQEDPAAAAPAPSEEERREQVRSCRTMTKQIAHYEDVVELARERDNELWEQATEQQITRLETRRARLCPEYAKDDGNFQAFVNFLVGAGRVAKDLFTLGLI